MSGPHDRLIALQREFFGILDEFFRSATGGTPSEFATFDSFGTRINSDAEKLARGALAAFPSVHDRLETFYEKYGTEMYAEAKKLTGLKFVLGGGSRFLQPQFDATRKVMLYADTVLIPDPILPWLEDPRPEERFRNVLFLQAVFALLHLKPLIDADLPYPAVAVFPSYEKSLERLDPTTQTRIFQLSIDILSPYLGRNFDSFDELARFAGTNEAEFLTAVDTNHLFVAQGGEIGQPLQDALKMYLENIKQWRSQDHVSAISKLPQGMLVLNALAERFTPQYHLLENAEEMTSCPTVCLPVQWHYYSLACARLEQQLRAQGLVDDGTIGTVRAINQPEFMWLGNIPIDQLVELRRNNENEEFRRNMKEQISDLHGAALHDLNRITSQVSRSITGILNAHAKHIAEIESKYRSKYRNFAIGSWITLAGALIPALAPFAGVTAPVAWAGTYLEAKLSERKERSKAAKSLMGVLAAAKADDQ